MISTASTTDLLGIGLYTPSEVALYARINVQSVTRWLYASTNSSPVFTPQIGEVGEDRVLTFLDFIQTLAIRSIRISKKVSLQKIREAVQQASQRYGIEYPLARQHTTYLYPKDSPKPNVVIRMQEDESDVEHLVQVTGNRKGQLHFLEVVDLFMDNVSWNDQGLANAYRAWKHRDVEINMDPRCRFGEPMVADSGYSANALWDAYQSEGSVENAAKCYGVNADEVRAAVAYFDHLCGTK